MDSGTMNFTVEYGTWASTAITLEGRYFRVDASLVNTSEQFWRAGGMPVRCLQAFTRGFEAAFARIRFIFRPESLPGRFFCYLCRSDCLRRPGRLLPGRRLPRS